MSLGFYNILCTDLPREGVMASPKKTRVWDGRKTGGWGPCQPPQKGEGRQLSDVWGSSWCSCPLRIDNRAGRVLANRESCLTKYIKRAPYIPAS